MNKLILGLCITTLSTSVLAANNKCVTPVAELVTNYGTIDVQLNPAKSPMTVANFEQYVNSGFYNGKVFHRVISGFMIQGGGFDGKMAEAVTKAPIKNEANNSLTNDKYTIAMARTQDPDSATAQFFINVNNNGFLNYTGNTPQGAGYAVFGKVIKGQKVVDKITEVKTITVGVYENVPATPVVIKSAKMLPCK